MESVQRYQRFIQIVIAVIALAGGVALYVLFPQTPAYAYGLLVGALGGIIKLRGQMRILHSLLMADDTGAARPMTGVVFRGFAIMIITIMLAVFSAGVLNVWTALAGLIMPTIILQLDGFLRPVAGTPEATPEAPATVGEGGQ